MEGEIHVKLGVIPAGVYGAICVFLAASCTLQSDPLCVHFKCIRWTSPT